jgi:hypothetical protein
MSGFVRQLAVKAIAFAMVCAMAFGSFNAVAGVPSSPEHGSSAHQHSGDHHGDTSASSGSDCTPVKAGCGTSDHHDRGAASSEECCAMACHSFMEATYLSTFMLGAVTSSLLILVPTGILGASSPRLERPPRPVHANG